MSKVLKELIEATKLGQIKWEHCGSGSDGWVAWEYQLNKTIKLTINNKEKKVGAIIDAGKIRRCIVQSNDEDVEVEFPEQDYRIMAFDATDLVLAIEDRIDINSYNDKILTALEAYKNERND